MRTETNNSRKCLSMGAGKAMMKKVLKEGNTKIVVGANWGCGQGCHFFQKRKLEPRTRTHSTR